MEKKKDRSTAVRRPDCVTETRMGNTIFVVSGFFKEGAGSTAADKMMKVLEAEGMVGNRAEYDA